ncbi:glycosyltransferase family 2 protein [Patescibacteria group bacterium]
MEERNYHATINIVTWNSEEYIEDLLKSLEAQNFLGFHVIVIDNGSTDKTLSIVQKFPRVTIIKNSSNLGFSRAHNKGIDMALKFWENKELSDRFIFITNPDIVFKDDCVKKLLSSFYNRKDVAVMGPKLLRLYEEEIDNLPYKSKSNIVDSYGLRMYRSRKTVDRFSGEEDKHIFKTEEVFGVSGALMCIRASALKDIKQAHEYFDEDFFAYKEDVDFCWRIRNMGWEIAIEPSAVAYHYRKVRGKEKMSLWQRHKNQKHQSKIIKFLSIRNNLWTIWKNDFLSNQLLHRPFIFFEEFGKFIYTLFLDTKNVRAYFSALFGLRKMLQKRKYLQNAKATAGEIRRWFK